MFFKIEMFKEIQSMFNFFKKWVLCFIKVKQSVMLWLIMLIRENLVWT